MEGAPRGPDLELRQLLPEHRTVSVGDLLSALDPAEHAGRDRPYTLVNFVATVDGRTSFLGRSGPIGDDGDRQMFHGLRERVDAVMAGTGDAAGRALRAHDPRPRAPPAPHRSAASRPSRSPCVVTRSGDVPTDIPLFAEPEARVVVFTPTDLDTSALRGAGRGGPARPGAADDDRPCCGACASDYGVRTLLCEGGADGVRRAAARGPRRRAVPDCGAEDWRAAARGRRSRSGPALPELLHLTLLWVLEREGSLFLRYASR